MKASPLFIAIHLLAAALCLPAALHAQSDSTKGGIDKNMILYDTVKVFYHTYDAPHLRHAPDSTISSVFRYNPVRQGEFESYELGNIGTAAGQWIFDPPLRRGFTVGINAYDIYSLRPEAMRFYHSQYPFTDLFYSQQSRNNNIIQARFGYKLGSQINYSIDYRLINQVGNLPYQRTRLNSTGIAFNYTHPTRRYSNYLFFTGNLFKIRDNGGIANPADLDGQIPEFISTLNVNLSSAASSTEPTTVVGMNRFLLVQYYHLYPSGKASPYFSHKLSYDREFYKYADTNPDDTYYDSIYVSNPRGLRRYIVSKSWLNELSYSQPLGNIGTLNAGISHRWLAASQAPDQETHNTIAALADARIHLLGERLSLSSQLWLGLAFWQAGDYSWDNQLDLRLGKWAALEGGFTTQLYSPSYLQRKLAISGSMVWDNSQWLGRTAQASLRAYINLRSLGLRVGIRQHTLANYIYFDTESKPAQASGALVVLQGHAQGQWHISRLHAEIDAVWQQSAGAGSSVRLPSLWTKGSLYLQGNIFKRRMNIRVGATARYISSYTPNAYNPLTGQFYLYDQVPTTRYYPLLDVFTAFKVKRFRFFFIGENLLQDVYQQAWYTAYLHPMPWRTFRFGVSWYMGD